MKKSKKTEQLELERKEREERRQKAIVENLSKEGRAAYKYFLQNIEKIAPRYFCVPHAPEFMTSRSSEDQMKELFKLAEKASEIDRWTARVKELENRLNEIRKITEGKNKDGK